MVTLGKKYKDRVSGFKGIATARHEYLNGCIRISLTSTELKDGAPIDPQSFDIEQLDESGAGIGVVKRATGGPGDVPAKRYTPRR